MAYNRIMVLSLRIWRAAGGAGGGGGARVLLETDEDSQSAVTMHGLSSGPGCSSAWAALLCCEVLHLATWSMN